MRVLVTGGKGFLGARLARHLSAAGQQVRLGTRSPGPAPAWLPHAEMAETRWEDPGALLAACANVDVLVHAAGMNAPDCAADPVGALQFNGVATTRLAQAAARAGVRRVVYLSTAHVYASPLAGTLDESACPRNMHPYASSHLAGENGVLQSAHGGAEAVVVRLSNACGVPVTANTNCWMLLFNDLCREAVVHRRLTLRSDPRQMRDFISMTDAVRAIEWLAEQSGAVEGVFNVGAGRSMTLLAMAQAVAVGCDRVLGFTPEFCLPPTTGATPASLDFRIDRLLATGFVLEDALATEIDATLRFCRDLEAG